MRNTYALERASAWFGLVFIALFGFGWLVLAHFFPPISPADSAQQVAEIYQSRHIWLMLGSVLIMLSILSLMPVSALLVLLINKIEARVGVLTLMMGFTLTTNLVLIFYTGLSFSAAAFRTDRSADLIQFANDLGFLQFIGGIPMFMMVWVILAYAILVVSPRTNPIVPRWVGYTTLWIAILFVPELLIYFFKHGIFAWDGIVGFWIPAVLLIGFCVLSPFILVPFARKHFR